MASWRDKAACASGGADLDLWFDACEDPETGERRIDDQLLAQCRRTCLSCPVRVRCHEDAMAQEGNAHEDKRFGVRAGTTPEQRASLYRRFAVRCPDCRETFDPMSAINGLLVCECGEQRMWEVDDLGDRWLDRHSALAERVRCWIDPHPWGDQIPSPTALSRVLGVRKDDVIRVYRALLRDGAIIEGETRGSYVVGQ